MLRLRLLVVIVGLGIGLPTLLLSCNASSDPQQAPVALIAMMRDQEAQTKQIRKRLLEGDSLLSDLTLLHDFKEGMPSAPDKNAEPFPELSDAFKQAYQEMIQQPGKITRYNVMINSCVDCHEQFCPGPLRQIKALQIQP
jgi:hypothetical protein